VKRFITFRMMVMTDQPEAGSDRTHVSTATNRDTSMKAICLTVSQPDMFYLIFVDSPPDQRPGASELVGRRH
jgi:hypothetical protein